MNDNGLGDTRPGARWHFKALFSLFDSENGSSCSQQREGERKGGLSMNCRAYASSDSPCSAATSFLVKEGLQVVDLALAADEEGNTLVDLLRADV